MKQSEIHERYTEAATFGGADAQELGAIISVADEVSADSITAVAGVMR